MFGMMEKYIGNWKNDKRNGQGTNIYSDGVQYIGEWKNDYINMVIGLLFFLVEINTLVS